MTISYFIIYGIILQFFFLLYFPYSYIEKGINKIFYIIEEKKLRLIKSRKNFYCYIIILIIVSKINKINLQETNELSYSFIIMKMAPGRHQVMSDGGGGIEFRCSNQFTKPSEIYINGENQSTIQPFYQFDKVENYLIFLYLYFLEYFSFLFYLNYIL